MIIVDDEFKSQQIQHIIKKRLKKAASPDKNTKET
jgi:hypothetical protein